MPDVTELQPNIPSFLRPLLQQYAQAQQSPDVIADPSNVPTSPGAEQAFNDIGQGMTQGQQAPNLRSTFLQADNGAPAHMTKGGKLVSILMSGLQGGLNGLSANSQTYAATGRNAGFGGGFAGAQMMPIQKQLLQGQATRIGLENNQLAQMLPFLRAQTVAGLYKTQSEIGKNQAEAGKYQAETAGMPIKQQLEQAQALAARYKEDPGSGTLIDLQTQQPVNTQGFAPLTDQEAAILGKQPGERVPLKLKNTANEMVNRGIRTTQANGRSLLVDNQGNTIKDMGAATPLAVINAQMGGGQVTPEMQTAAGAVAQGKVDLATAIRPFNRFPGQAETFIGEVLRQNPQFTQAQYGVSKKTMEYFTTGQGANELTAFRTAINHADLLMQAGEALNNGDIRMLNSLNNTLHSQFGDPRLTTFQAIANTYRSEVTKAINGGHITEGELNTQGATLPSNANFETLKSVANAYKNLMASKAQQRMVQYEQGMQGKPAFPQQQGGQSFSVTYGGKTYTFKDQQSLDGFKGEMGIK